MQQMESVGTVCTPSGFALGGNLVQAGDTHVKGRAGVPTYTGQNLFEQVLPLQGLGLGTWLASTAEFYNEPSIGMY